MLYTVQYVSIFCLVSCIIYLVSCFLFPVSCLLSPVSCLMCHVYCYTVFSHWIVGAVGREVRIDAWEVTTRVKVQCGLLYINFPQTFLQLMPKKVLKIPKLSTTNTWKSVKIPRRRGGPLSAGQNVNGSDQVWQLGMIWRHRRIILSVFPLETANDFKLSLLVSQPFHTV